MAFKKKQIRSSGAPGAYGMPRPTRRHGDLSQDEVHTHIMLGAEAAENAVGC